MAEPTLTEGDTTPPIRGAAVQSNGEALMPIGDADELLFLGVPDGAGTVIEGKAEAIAAPDPEAAADKTSLLGYNWRYPLAAEDTAPGSAGSYTSWLKAIWDADATPPLIEWIKGDKFTIQAAPE
jgi:hypothetical protein